MQYRINIWLISRPPTGLMARLSLAIRDADLGDALGDTRIEAWFI
jgi:hypothetical protein